MPETLQGNYQSVSDMDQNVITVSGRNFFVHLAGITNGAHQSFVTKLKGNGQIQVNSPGESDYLLVFCPVASRVGTDISEALDQISGDKPVILVVMHHTFDPDHVVADSRRLVTNPNVLLTVDCLFHEGKLLNCNRNDIALFEVLKFLRVPAFQGFIWKIVTYCWNWPMNNWKLVVCVGIGVVVYWNSWYLLGLF